MWPIYSSLALLAFASVLSILAVDGYMIQIMFETPASLSRSATGRFYFNLYDHSGNLTHFGLNVSDSLNWKEGPGSFVNDSQLVWTGVPLKIDVDGLFYAYFGLSNNPSSGGQPFAKVKVTALVISTDEGNILDYLCTRTPWPEIRAKNFYDARWKSWDATDEYPGNPSECE